MPKKKPAKKAPWIKVADGIYWNRKEKDQLRFRARFVASDANGKRRDHYGPHRTDRAEAENDLRRMQTDAYHGGAEKLDANRVTFAQLVAEFSKTLTEAQYSDAQQRKLEKLSGLAGWQDGLRVMKMFDAVWGSRAIRSIKAHDVRQWKAQRMATKRGKNQNLVRSLSGVNGELRFLRKAFSFAVDREWLDRNPFTGAKIINSKNEHRRETALTDEEETKILDACDHEFLKDLLTLLFDTGMRLGEAQGLTREMIKLHQGQFGHIYLSAAITKGKEKRDVPVLTPRLREVIERRFAILPNEPKVKLFPKSTSIRFAWDTTRAKANLQRDGEPLDLELRDTRHTWISNAVRRGIPLPEAMQYSGHKVVDTFLRYLQPSQEAHDANVQRYNAAIMQVQEPLASATVN
jgi:integrase